MQYFCAYVVLSGSMEPEIPTDLLWLWMDGRRNGIRGCDYLPERKYGGDTPDRGKKSEEGYCTKGDANAEEDAGIVLEKQVIRECDRSSSLAWLWYHLAPAERNTLFSGRGSGDAFLQIRQLWHGRKIMQENKL